MVSGGLEFEAQLLVVQWLLYLFTYLANMAATPQPWLLLPYCGGSTHCLAANEGSNESARPPDQFESSAAHLAAIVAFRFGRFLVAIGWQRQLHGNKKVTKYTIVTTIPMATTYCPCSLVTVVDIRGAKTIVTIVHGRCAGRRCGRLTLISWRTAAT